MKLWMFKGPALFVFVGLLTWPIQEFIFDYAFWELAFLYAVGLLMSVPMYAPVKPVNGRAPGSS